MYKKLLDIRKRVEKQAWHEQDVNKRDKMANIVWTHISAIYNGLDTTFRSIIYVHLILKPVLGDR